MRRFLALFAVLMLSGVLASAQDHSVKGHVTGPDGNSLPGITVQVKGSNTATATNSNGQFELTVPANATLIFTGVGFTEQTIKVGNRTTVDVTLASDAKRLNEVVVTALGIKRQQRALGYGTQNVGAKELNVSKPVTIGEGLTGKVAGLQINTINNGVDPGIRVVLRGYRHLNADNQALIVVDGIAVRSDFLSTINPNDVESINILKGASAAALYGVDATNGVLVITTKKGSENGKPVIEYNNTTMLESVSYMPALQNTFSPGSSETGAYNWPSPSFVPDPSKVYYFQNPYTGEVQYVPYENQNFGIRFNGDPNLGYIGGPGPDSTFFKQPFQGINPDPRRAFFQTGYRMQNNLSYSGGDSKNSYFLSVQDVSVKGVLPKDQGRRTDLYFSGKKTYGKFSATYNLSYAQKYSNTVGGDFNQNRPVYWNLLNQGANIPLNDPRIKDPSSPYFLDRYYNAYYPNPWWQIYNSRVINRTNYFTGNLQLNLQATNWLNLTYRAGTQFTSFDNNSYIAAVSFSPWAVSDPWGAGNTASGVGLHKNGSASYTNANARNITQDMIATIQKSFGDIDATLILGNEIAEKPYGTDYSSITSVSSGQLFVDNFYNTDYRLGELTGSHYIEQTRLISGYGDLTLGYKNYLFLHGSFRRDYSSLLPKGKNAYNFWSADASWVFTDAIKSLQNQDLISYGKLRVAYSNTGDITLRPYNVQNVFDVAGGFPYGSQAGIVLDGAYRNPNLVPEKTVEKEVGLELGLFNGRINLDADYYYSLTSGQTFPVNVSATTGYSSAFVNAGDVVSQGVEVGVTATVVQNNSSRLKWDVGGNFTWNGSNVQSLYQGSRDFTIGGYGGLTGSDHAVVGQPFPVIETVDLRRDPQGRVIIDPSTGYPILGDTLQIVGQVNPKYMVNVNTTLSWKNFSLNAQASYQGGNTFFAYVGQQLDFAGVPQWTTTNGRQRFIFPNSVYLDNGKYVPNDKYYTVDGNLNFWTNSPYAQAGTSFMESAAFWKLRNVSLTYDFKDVIQNVHWLHGLTFSVIGKNLIMLRPSQNVWTDPEFNYSTGNAQGITNYDQLPPTRQYGASLNIKF
ncbi:MAG: SusC/RagA family TonB-linked outer membrane protein [Bacteroidota bacterium]|nr:SusC/RagA family TonB-linked outer membrane protein [Bacteroidota bacterium]